MNIRFNLILYIIFSLVLFASLRASAQITIGMLEEPVQGALLDLKTQTSDVTTNANSNKGLALPRVNLVDLNLLRPMFDTDEEALDVTNMMTHTGLMVYNLTDDPDRHLLEGVYIWDGEKWDPVIPYDDSNEVDLAGANSYILNPGQSVTIPVLKAYSAWENYSELGNLVLTGAVTTEIFWQDVADVVSSVSLASGDQGRDSQILVQANNTNTMGNAVVLLRVDGVIRWSWHIWVTDYDLENVAGQRTNNGFTFMDRNLGAINTTPGDVGSFGMMYQWGRKDPFPGSVNVNTGVEPVLIGVSLTVAPVATASNLANAIMNPLTFYTQPTDPFDWYTNSDDFQNDYLWRAADGGKSVFDPCPATWRMPTSGVGTASPWFGLLADDFIAATGADWGIAGYYPAAGNRSNYTAAFDRVGTGGDVWSGSPSTDNGSYSLSFLSGDISPSASSRRAQGFSVRCVKMN